MIIQPCHNSHFLRMPKCFMLYILIKLNYQCAFYRAFPKCFYIMKHKNYWMQNAGHFYIITVISHFISFLFWQHEHKTRFLHVLASLVYYIKQPNMKLNCLIQNKTELREVLQRMAIICQQFGQATFSHIHIASRKWCFHIYPLRVKIQSGVLC